MRILRLNQLILAGACVLGAALGAGCQSVSNYVDQVRASPSSGMDAYGPSTISTSSTRSSQKLPAKDPHAFSIGAVLPLTGLRASSGQAMQRGLDLAVAETNAGGGINGQPIQLDVLDSRDDLDTGAAALEQLRDRGEAVILVGDGPLAVAAAAQLAEFPQLVGFLCDYVTVPRLTPKNGVRIYLNGDQEARAITDYISASGITRVAILNQNDLAGQSHQQYLSYQFSGNHDIYTATESYAGNERDFSLLAKAMLRVNSGALILAGVGPEYPNIMTAFEGINWKGSVFGLASVNGLAGQTTSGGLAGSAAYPLPDFAANPRNTAAGRAFADQFHAKYGEDPALPAAYAYDNIRVLAAAAASAATNDPLKIRDGFLALHTYTGAVGRYEIKDDGDTEMPLRLLHADGQIVPPATPSSGPPPSYQTINLTTPEIIAPAPTH
jgi:branched-chain amino acid transport system substrate-binding protein